MSLFLLFLYTSSLSLLLPLFFPSIPLLYYAPFLIICFYRSPQTQALWWSVLCGFIIDLLSTHTRLGSYALSFCLTTAYLYHYKFQFFEDRLSTFPVMTFLFVLLSTLILRLIYYIEGVELLISWEWAKNDLLFMPLKDSLYAFLFFSLPSLFLSHSYFRRILFSRRRRRHL